MLGSGSSLLGPHLGFMLWLDLDFPFASVITGSVLHSISFFAAGLPIGGSCPFFCLLYAKLGPLMFLRVKVWLLLHSQCRT
jgi:hypothetical protein